ncbi:hypothetical protein KSE_59320 [Kitasatospora setae KM-6054]|uniref:Uncharacterized protein n=1 Tax=Kitasatospora setae (strain ATCC 33774 / DSM 43861 / JCM 3304 / KCC A-0304 / NBRC 14216 / KM-6054) TaxID=452652 RepID=E4N0L8_KITSK|nr:hypothetical protein KSE_59320 [Kitasatospora setae KM-6054]
MLGPGFTGRIHLSADGCCRPLSVIVTPRQRADCTRFVPVLKNSRAVANRYGRRGYVFLGTVTAAALVIRLRT